MLNRLGLIKMGKHFLDSRDNAALKLLAPYMPEQYFAWSQNSIKPSSLLAFVNDILINDRKTIVEFGAGISTIIIANIIEKHGLDKELISFEHDQQWINCVQNHFKCKRVSIHKVDLCTNPPHCYEKDTILKVLDRVQIDSALVDGPPAYNWKRRRSRRDILRLIKPNLNDDKYAIFLDDVNRPSEYKSMKLWSKELGQKSGTVRNCIGFVVKGDHYSFK